MTIFNTTISPALDNTQDSPQENFDQAQKKSMDTGTQPTQENNLG